MKNLSYLCSVREQEMQSTRNVKDKRQCSRKSMVADLK
nr:MAG TPA: hypothetical protein [Caudoviricetes sp.]